MFITNICVLFLIMLQWPKTTSLYNFNSDVFTRVLVFSFHDNTTESSGRGPYCEDEQCGPGSTPRLGVTYPGFSRRTFRNVTRQAEPFFCLLDFGVLEKGSA